MPSTPEEQQRPPVRRPAIRENAGTAATVVGLAAGTVSLIETIASNEATIVQFIQIFGTILMLAELAFIVLLLVGGFLVHAKYMRNYAGRIMLACALSSVVIATIGWNRWGADWGSALLGYGLAAVVLGGWWADARKAAKSSDSSGAAS